MHKQCKGHPVTLINTNQRKAGIVLVVASAIVFSSAGVFTNGVSTDAWGVIFWRGVAAAAFTLIYLVLRGALLAEIRAFNKPAFFVTLMMAAGTAAFIPAFKLSSVANVALIYATAPFIAAGLSWIFIKELPTTRVIFASLAALGGVFVIVSASFGGSQLTGDFLALFMTLMMSGIMVVYRKFPSTTAALPAALSSIVVLPFALAYGDPFAVQSHELPILIAFGLVFAVASVTLTEGARRLPSAETALLSTLEMPLAPVLAFLVLSEVPTSPAIIGGSIIFLAVVWSQKRNA
ncbi:EamA domain-containing membrane protein RarD [Sulfitobacter marinus]|uniref:EamA domain-containing membrane protein RarD n=1 Tax=Sulfitobacter marinus TaxID=394264 RepID=A0A1I6PUL5_9RHOB|nr:EamA domain-containing membrane protein RarD [Sulfitobacter marinus]